MWNLSVDQAIRRAAQVVLTEAGAPSGYAFTATDSWLFVPTGKPVTTETIGDALRNAADTYADMDAFRVTVNPRRLTRTPPAATRLLARSSRAQAPLHNQRLPRVPWLQSEHHHWRTPCAPPAKTAAPGSP